VELAFTLNALDFAKVNSDARRDGIIAAVKTAVLEALGSGYTSDDIGVVLQAPAPSAGRRLTSDSVVAQVSVTTKAGAKAADLEANLVAKKATMESEVKADVGAIVFIDSVLAYGKSHSDISATESLLPKMQVAQVSAKESAKAKERCFEFKDFCATPTRGWNTKTSCTCSGEVVGDAKIGAYCSPWTSGNSAHWCLVSEDASCGPVEKFGDSGKFRSSGPCTSKVEPYPQMLLNSRWWFKSLLHFGGLLGFMACLSAACQVAKMQDRVIYIAPGPGRAPGEWTREDVLQWLRDTPPPEQFVWATQEAASKVSTQTADDARLELFALYHQAVDGDAPQFVPNMGVDKFTSDAHLAWQRLSGMNQTEARRRYVKLVADLCYP